MNQTRKDYVGSDTYSKLLNQLTLNESQLVHLNILLIRLRFQAMRFAVLFASMGFACFLSFLDGSRGHSVEALLLGVAIRPEIFRGAAILCGLVSIYAFNHYVSCLRDIRIANLLIKRQEEAIDDANETLSVLDRD